MTCELPGGAIFLHVPRTGGNWVYDVLKELGLVHRRVGRHPHTAFERAVMFPNGKRKWKEWLLTENWHPENWLRPGQRMALPYTFCFVRHPVRWYESWWRYLTGKGEITWLESARNEERYLKRWTAYSVPSQAFCGDFNTFVKGVHTRFPGYVTWMYGNFVVPETNFVGRQERLPADLVHVLKHLGLKFDEERVLNWPRVNAAKVAEAAIHWDPGLLAEVQAAEHTAMLKYGYEMVGAKDMREAKMLSAT